MSPSDAPRTQLLRPADLGPAALEQWRELADRAMDPNPFVRPEFVLPASRTCAPDTLLAVVSDGDGWIACQPVVRRAGWRRIPFPCFAPWLPAYAYLATPLVDSARVREGVEGLLDLVGRDRWATMLVLDHVDPATPVGLELTAAARRRSAPPVIHTDLQRAELRRRPTPTYLEEAVSAQGRKKLRKAARRLAEVLEEAPRVRERSGDPEAVQAFLDLEATGWKAERANPIAREPADAAFFREMCAEFAAAGRLELLSLEGAGRIASMQCNLRDGPDLYAFRVAHEPDLRPASPGTVLEVEAMDRFHTTPGLERVDSCAAPDSPLVNRLWPDRRRLQVMLLPGSPRVAGSLKVAVRAEAAARRAYRRARPRPDAR